MSNIQWYAIVEESTGRLHSTATVIASPDVLKANGMEAVPLAFDPQDGTKEWDQANRRFIERTVIERTNLEIAVQAAERLTLGEKAQLKAML